jgi:hypothetical protein
MLDLNSEISIQLNSTLNSAIAINSSGKILAYGQGGTNYAENAFLLTPVGMSIPETPTLAPEPGPLAIPGLTARRMASSANQPAEKRRRDQKDRLGRGPGTRN